MTSIHPTALISNSAEIGENVIIGPYCLVGPNVILGKGCELKNNVTIQGKTYIGNKCTFFPFSVIGMIPQDLKYKGEETELIIGNNNTFREHSTVHIGTEFGGRKTCIGNNNLIMTGTHVAHDCNIGNNVILSHHVALAGHVKVEDHAILSAMVGVVQFRRIGKYSMIGGLCAVDTDIIPFSVASPKDGSRAFISGVNIIGMKRKGFNKNDIELVNELYNVIFDKKITMSDRIKTINSKKYSSEVFNEIKLFLNEDSKSGLCQPF